MTIEELEQDLIQVGRHIRSGNKGYAIELLEKWVDVPTTRSNSKEWPPKERLEKMYHEEGMSLREVGNEIDRSYQGVKDYFDRIGIETRDPNGS